MMITQYSSLLAESSTTRHNAYQKECQDKRLELIPLLLTMIEWLKTTYNDYIVPVRCIKGAELFFTTKPQYNYNIIYGM